MKRIALFLIAVLFPLIALAGGSTIDITQPAANSLLSSLPIRNNFTAAYNDVNHLYGQSNSPTAPVAPILGQLWLNTAGIPYALNEWDGNQWVVMAYMNASLHTWVTPSASLPLGTSVSNPGTGLLETLLPVQTQIATSYVYTGTDLFKKTRRSNAGVAMTDTLPAAAIQGLTNGTRLNIANYDSSASITISPGTGTTLDGSSSSYVLPAGRDLSLTYDATNTTWRGVDNTRTMVLFTGTSPTATQLYGGTTIPGQSSAVTMGTCMTLSSGVLSDICGGTVTGPGTTVSGYAPLWNSTNGTALGSGLPVATTGNNTIVETGSGGTISASVLPNPSASTLGGVESYTAPSNQFMTGISTSGVPQSAQPSFSNLSGSSTCAQLPALTGSVTTSAGSCATTIANSGVIAGSYSSTNLTVSADGRITSASNGTGGGYPSNFLVKTTSYTAAIGDNVLADTSGGAFTITLPASPSQFNQICVKDAAGSFGTNTLTIAGNSSNIMSSSSNMTVTTPYVSFCLIYYTSSTGWRVE